jgi:hypothetical protein
VIVKSTKIPLRKRADDKTRGAVTAREIQSIPSRRRVHKIKVLAVRQQLVEGRYDFEERLEAAVERLIATVTA